MVRARRAEVVRQVKRAYYDVAYLDRAIAITAEEEELLRHYESLAQARYSQGVGLQQAVVKLQAEITRVRSRRQEILRDPGPCGGDLERPARPARASPGSPPVGPVDRPVAAVDGERLQGIARTDRPEVRAALLRAESEDESVRLARRQYWPRHRCRRGVGKRRRPPGRRGAHAASAPRTAGMSTACPSASAFRSTHGRSMTRAYGRRPRGIRRQRKRIVTSSTTWMPPCVRPVSLSRHARRADLPLHKGHCCRRRNRALRSTEEAYSAGTTGVLELLDSEEVLLDVRLGLARLETDYMKTLAEMERAIGSAFPLEESP